MTENPNRTATAQTTAACETPSRTHPDRRILLRCAALGCAAVMAAALLGCSSTKSSSSSTTSPATTAPSPTTYPAGKEQVCQARDQLKTSVSALTDPALLTKGASAITAAVSQVQTDLESLKAAARQDYQPQIDALQASLSDLQTAAGNLGNGNIAQNLTTVGTAIAAVGTDASALFNELKTTCG
jgi:hypothetical protein